MLFVIDGGKALRSHPRLFGEHVLLHRCHRHQETT